MNIGFLYAGQGSQHAGMGADLYRDYPEFRRVFDGVSEGLQKNYFDRNYDKLPNFCSLLIKVKFIEYDKNNQVSKNTTIFWANRRLFDEDNRLIVGLHKVNLHKRESKKASLINTEVSDDVYYSFNDNPDEENSSKIYQRNNRNSRENHHHGKNKGIFKT